MIISPAMGFAFPNGKSAGTVFAADNSCGAIVSRNYYVELRQNDCALPIGTCNPMLVLRSNFAFAFRAAIAPNLFPPTLSNQLNK